MTISAAGTTIDVPAEALARLTATAQSFLDAVAAEREAWTRQEEMGRTRFLGTASYEQEQWMYKQCGVTDAGAAQTDAGGELILAMKHDESRPIRAIVLAGKLIVLTPDDWDPDPAPMHLDRVHVIDLADLIDLAGPDAHRRKGTR